MDKRTPGQKRRNKPKGFASWPKEKVSAAGKLGGKARVPTKGFGSWPKEKLQEMLRKNARNRKPV